MNNEINKAKLELERWLSHPNELGKKPSKIEYTNSFEDEDGIKCLIFKYKKSIFGKWLLGIVSESGVFSEMQEYNKNTEIEDAKTMLEVMKNYWKSMAEEMEAEVGNDKSVIEKHSDTAVEYAKSFEKDFDYSKDSIKDLEEILDYYSNDIRKSNPTDDEIWSMAVIFGSYLGETMLKNGLSEKGFHWGTDNTSDIPLLMFDSKYITPIDRVCKRLVYGDSVVQFYDFFMKMEM